MEALAIMGFIFGMAGFAMANTAKKELEAFTEEFQKLKQDVADLEILNTQK